MTFVIETKTQHPKSKWVECVPRETWPTKAAAERDAKSIRESNPTWKTRVVKLRGVNKLEEPTQEKLGCVCFECGRTVTEKEYSYGETTCCHAGVIPEEDFGKIDGFTA